LVIFLGLQVEIFFSSLRLYRILEKLYSFLLFSWNVLSF